MNFVTFVPAGDEVNATWEKASFNNAEQSTGHSKCLPGLDKPHANCNSSPTNDNNGKPISCSNSANNKIGRKFKKKITTLSNNITGAYPGKKTRRATL